MPVNNNGDKTTHISVEKEPSLYNTKKTLEVMKATGHKHISKASLHLLTLESSIPGIKKHKNTR